MTVRSLEAKGNLELGHDRSRRISLHRTGDGRRRSAETMCSPVAGHITGHGTPRTTHANVIGEAIELARSMLGGREDVYAIRVRDDTLTDALVKPGDVVVLAHAGGVANGELAAGRVAGRDGRKPTTLKYYYRENGHVRLQPAHPDMPPLYYQRDQVTVQGRVVLIMRQSV
jgi:SOS-response transcriptional repressor LexA